MSTKRHKLTELNKQAIQCERNKDYTQALEYAKEMIAVDTECRVGYFRKASAYIGLGQCEKAIALCDDAVYHHSNTTTNDKKDFVKLKKWAIKHMARYGRNPKIDFVKMLPQKLVYKVFCHVDAFRDFATSTHVSRVWRETLMDNATNIWLKRSIVFFAKYPLKRLTSEEQRALTQALRGEKHCYFSFVARTFERAQAIGSMGNCGLQSVDLSGFPYHGQSVIEANANTLRKVTLSISSSRSLDTLLPAIAKSSTLSELCFISPFHASMPPTTVAFFFGKQDRLPSLTHVTINGFKLDRYSHDIINDENDSRIAFVKFFLVQCPNLKVLAIYPAVNATTADEQENLPKDIKIVMPQLLNTLIF